MYKDTGVRKKVYKDFWFSVNSDLITEKFQKTGYPLSRRKKGGTCDEVKE